MVQMAVLFCKRKFWGWGGVGWGEVSECQTKSSLREKKKSTQNYLLF